MVVVTYDFGYFNPNLVETLIVLILKIDSPLFFKDFRPISLYSVLFKIISKVLVNRISLHLNKNIGPLQNNFIPKRGTSDNALVTQEIIHHMHKKKKGKKKTMSCLR
uniref:Retrovirus-related Pol polyprotein from type-2 retrotransposable element R2DM n=1 Tax=Cajanus cajan TaxID=3821 RepID=A0A151SC02_CAJCA|nr:Retrovirus-related Pol polyprotein from type-2 retrotransposable element R2DM [Cajanus cajan]